MNQAIDQMSRPFVNGPGDWSSIPGRFIPQNQKKKKLIIATMLKTQHYKVRIKGKTE